jgi:hypothetical protein
MKLFERDVSVSKKFDQFFDLRGSFFAKWIFKIPIFTQKLGHVWHKNNCYIFTKFFEIFVFSFSFKTYLSNECKIIMLG